MRSMLKLRWMVWCFVVAGHATAAPLSDFVDCFERFVLCLPDGAEGFHEAERLAIDAFRAHRAGRWVEASDDLLRRCRVVSGDRSARNRAERPLVFPLAYLGDIRAVSRTTRSLTLGLGGAAIVGLSGGLRISHTTRSDGWWWLEMGAEVGMQVGLGSYLFGGYRTERNLDGRGEVPRPSSISATGVGEEIMTAVPGLGLVMEDHPACGTIIAALGGALTWGWENRGGVQLTRAFRTLRPLLRRFERYAAAYDGADATAP